MFMAFNARAVGLDLDAEETLEIASQSGFEGVDLMVRDIANASIDTSRLRTRMSDLGLRGGAFPLPMNWRRSAEEFERDLEQLPRYAAVAAELGLFRTGTWVLPELPQGDNDLAATFSLHVDRLGTIASVLERSGIRLGLEVIGVASSRTPGHQPFIHRMADLDSLMKALGERAPNIGVLVDLFHLYAAGEAIEAGLAWGVGRVVWVHVADLPANSPADRAVIRDLERGLPGENGAVPSGQMLVTLNRAGYDGPVTAEPFGACLSIKGLPPLEVACRVATEFVRSGRGTLVDDLRRDSTAECGLVGQRLGKAIG